MSKSADVASKKRKGGPEIVEVKKRTKVTVQDSEKSKKPSKVQTTEITTISSSNAPEAKKTHIVKKSKSSKPSKSAKEAESSGADDFGGFTDSEDEAGASTADHTNALLAGFSSESESDGEQAAAISKIPSLPDSSDLKAQLAAVKVNPDSVPGTIYLGRIPHGFYEPQMRDYFSQFGTISRLRLSRNKLTGKPKHYAYIEFESSSVADIVAKTMDKYLMFGHILQARLLKPEEVHAELWKGANTRFKAMPRNRIEKGQLDKPKARDVWEKRVKKEEKRRKSKAEKLSDMGYEFDMPKVKAVEAVPKRNEGKSEVEAEAEAKLSVAETATQQGIEDKANDTSIIVEEVSEVVEVVDASGEKRKKGRKEKKVTKKARVSI